MMTVNDPLRIGTRASALARIQTDWVIEKLLNAHPALRIETVVIRTTGDAVIDRALSKIGGKGLFTKELEDALLAGRIDLAVHSLKDLPTEFADGLALGAVPERQDPRDALVGTTIDTLRASPAGVKVGSSSLRRAAQLRRMFPLIEVTDIRGNVDTRLRKVKEGKYDAAVMALAGLCRLHREHEARDVFQPDQMLPAPGQGALGIEIRADDHRLKHLLEPIHCTDVYRCVTAERAFLHRLGGGCQVPVAALATIDAGTLTLRGRVVSLDGSRLIEGSRNGPPEQASDIGEHLAEELIQGGAAEIIDEISKQLSQGAEPTHE
jgi:hydroxymethylbilane synthase